MRMQGFDVVIKPRDVTPLADINRQLHALRAASVPLSKYWGKNTSPLATVLAESVKVTRSLRRKRKSREQIISVSRKLDGINFEANDILTFGPDRAYIVRSLITRVRKDIQQHRKHRQALPYNYTFHEYGLTVPKMAECYTEPGTFLKLRKKKLRMDIFKVKRPAVRELNYVGVELEFASKRDMDAVADALFEAGLSAYVTVKRDGSIKVMDTHPHAIEVAIMATQSEIGGVVVRVCNTLNDIVGVKVNASCGLHVHLDQRNRSVVKSYNNLVSMQHFLYAMNPASRKASHYCKPNSSKQWAKRPNERYYAINAEAFSKFNTLECRLHTGTTDGNKIKNWVDLLVAICEADEIRRAPSTLKGFQKMLNLPNELFHYVEARIEKFKPEHNPSDSPEINPMGDDSVF